MKYKIKSDIDELVEEQVISEDIAIKIEQYYRAKEDGKPNKLFVLFAVLGSLLTGLGIILILAHNWDTLSKTIKTIFVFAPLVIGQLIVGYTILKQKSTTWREASGVFLFFAIGACLALIGQIYNIPGNLSSYLLSWTLLASPLIYLLRSKALMILYIMFATYYACEFGYFNSFKTPWMYFVLIAIITPFYYKILKEQGTANVTSIINWLLPLSIVVGLGAFVGKNEMFNFLMYIGLFGLLYNIGRIPYFENQKLRRNGYLILGSLGTIVTLLFTTFEGFWKEILYKPANLQSQESYIALFFFVLIILVIAYSYSRQWITKFKVFQYVSLIFLFLFFIGFYNETFATILSNVLLLALGLTTIKNGIDKFHFGILYYGMLIVTVLIICRFFDTNISFELRGLLFVLVGVGFFVTNYIMLKKQKLKEKNN